jgi:histidyl-tRNA synthetase
MEKKMKRIVSPVKGTRDFYPEEMAMRNWLYSSMRQVAESFGYQEYETPILETLELYAAKSGEELVQEQSFVFSDRGGDKITLRPELTPSLSRMVAQRQKQLIYPLRWWSFGPFWRYERPQKGRTREFFQWNVDLLGVDSPEADAEIIAVVASFFEKVGLKPEEVVILVNNRKLIDSEIQNLGIDPNKKTDILNLIDRRSKLNASEWDSYARSLDLNLDQISRLKAILDNPALWEKSPELNRLFIALKSMGVVKYVRFDANIVRGLLYYTGTVFEAFDLSGDIRRSILGGGRYDNLLSDVGGENLPAVGFAMGDVIMTLLLQRLGRIPPDLDKPTAQVLVTVFEDRTIPESLILANELRQHGIPTLCYPEACKLGKQLRYADRTGIKIVLVLGPDEIKTNQVAVKDLTTGSQQLINRMDITRVVSSLLSQSL